MFTAPLPAINMVYIAAPIKDTNKLAKILREFRQGFTAALLE